MTDRFYPIGLPHEVDAWKTTYEVQNEMRSFDRSAYPPGCAVHLPGARDKFGHSTPGPLPHRLAHPELTLRDEVGIANPRAHLAVPRMQAPYDRHVFENHDVPEMQRTYHSPVASATLSPGGGLSRSMSRSRSSPGFGTMKRTVNRLSEPRAAITRLEDDHFSYFVPKAMQREGKEKISQVPLSKLQKERKVTMPFAGDGTGFRTQGGQAEWWPAGSYANVPTAYRETFIKPPFYRMSPLDQSGPFGQSA